MKIWRWLPVLACLPVTLSITPKPAKSVDSDESSQVLGSSVVTSVSVIMDHGNGTKTIFPEMPSQVQARPNIVGSPGNMLEPDRYEFYTFDETGDLVKRLMTLEEIQGLIAGGDSEGIVGEASAPTYYHESMAALPDEQTHIAANDFDSSSNSQGVHKVVESVQNVLKSELAATQSKPYPKPLMDLHPNPEWSILLPGLLGENSDESLPPSDINHLGDLSSMASENNYYQSTPNSLTDTSDSNDDKYQKTQQTIIHYIPIENVPIKSSGKKPSKMPVSSTTSKVTDFKPIMVSTEKYGTNSLSPSKYGSSPSTEKYVYPPSTTFGKYSYVSSPSTEKPTTPHHAFEKLNISSPSSFLNDKLSSSSTSSFSNDKQSYPSFSNSLNDKGTYSTSSNLFNEKNSYSNPPSTINDRFISSSSVLDKNKNHLSHSTEKIHHLSPSTEQYFYTGPSTEKKYFSNYQTPTTEKLYYPSHTTDKQHYPTAATENKYFSSLSVENNGQPNLSTEGSYVTISTSEKHYLTNSILDKIKSSTHSPDRSPLPVRNTNTHTGSGNDKHSSAQSTEVPLHYSHSPDRNNYVMHSTEKYVHPQSTAHKHDHAALTSMKTDLVSSTEKFSPVSFSTKPSPTTNKYFTPSRTEYPPFSSEKLQALHNSSPTFFYSKGSTATPTVSSTTYSTPFKTQSISLNDEMAASLSDVISQMTDQPASVSNHLSTILVPTTTKTSSSFHSSTNKVPEKFSTKYASHTTPLVTTAPTSYSTTTVQPFFTKTTTYNKLTTFNNFTKIKPMFTTPNRVSPHTVSQIQSQNKVSSPYPSTLDFTKKQPSSTNKITTSDVPFSSSSNKFVQYNYSADFRNNPTTISAATSSPSPSTATPSNPSRRPSPSTPESTTASTAATTTGSTTTTTTTTPYPKSSPSTSQAASPPKPNANYKRPSVPLTKISISTPAPSSAQQQSFKTNAASTLSSTSTSSISPSVVGSTGNLKIKHESQNSTQQKLETSFTKLPTLSKVTEKPVLRPIVLNKTSDAVPMRESISHAPIRVTPKPPTIPHKSTVTSNSTPTTTKLSTVAATSAASTTTTTTASTTTTSTTTTTTSPAPPTATVATATTTTQRPSLETAPPSKFSPQYTYKYPVKKPGGSLHGPYYYPTTPLQLKHAAAQLAAAHNNSLKLNLTSMPPLGRVPFPTNLYKQGSSSSPIYMSTAMFRNSTNRTPGTLNSYNTLISANTTSSYQNTPSSYSIRPSLQNYTSSVLMSSQRYSNKLPTTTEIAQSFEATTGSQVISNGHQNYVTKTPQVSSTYGGLKNLSSSSESYQKVSVQDHTPTSTPSYKNAGLQKVSSNTTPRFRPTQMKISSINPFSSNKLPTTNAALSDTIKTESRLRVPSTTTTRFEEYIPVQTQQHTTSYRYSSTSATPSTGTTPKLMSDQSTERLSTHGQIFTGTFSSIDDAVKKLSTLSLRHDYSSNGPSSTGYTSAAMMTEKASTAAPLKNDASLKSTLGTTDSPAVSKTENKPATNSSIDDHIQDGISAVTNILLQSKGPDSHLTNSTTLNRDLVQALEEGALLMPNAVLGEMKHSGSIESQIVSNMTDEGETEHSVGQILDSTESVGSTTILDSLTTMGSKKETDSKENWLSDSSNVESVEFLEQKDESAAKSSDDNNLESEGQTTTVEYSEPITETTKREYVVETTVPPEIEEPNPEITTVSPALDDSFNKFRTENIEKDETETTIKEADVTTTSTTVTTTAPVAPSTKVAAEPSTTVPTSTTVSSAPAKEPASDFISEKTVPRPVPKPTFSAVPSIPKIPGPGAYRPITPPTAVELHPAPHESMGLEASIAFLGDDVRRFSDLCNELSFRMWTSITGKGMISSRSLVLSPFAVTSMLAMVFLGARGSTSGQMNDVLRLDDMVTFNPHQVLQNITESVINSRNIGSSTAAFVRELYSDKGKGKILEFYKERAQQYYDGHVEEVNFSTIGDVLRRRTNLLIKRQTLGRIPEYLRGSSLNLKPPMAAFAANIFQTDCDLASTDGRDGEMYFVVRPSTRQRRLVPVPAAVWRSGFLAGYEPGLDATAVSIGSDSVVSTIFVLPGQQGQVAPGDGLARLEQRLIETSYRRGGWSRLLRSLLLRPGLEIQLPRFSHRSVLNVTSALQRMGLKDIFDAEKADLRGLNGYTNDLYLSDMVQVNTFSTCGEDAAGARHHVETYPSSPQRVGREDPEVYPVPDDLDLDVYSHLPLNLRPRQARLPDNPRLRFDRPFLYLVRHNPTGMILHVGRFNPRLLP